MVGLTVTSRSEFDRTSNWSRHLVKHDDQSVKLDISSYMCDVDVRLLRCSRGLCRACPAVNVGVRLFMCCPSPKHSMNWRPSTRRVRPNTLGLSLCFAVTRGTCMSDGSGSMCLDRSALNAFVEFDLSFAVRS